MSRSFLVGAGISMLACAGAFAEDAPAEGAAEERPTLLVMTFKTSGIDPSTAASIEDIAADALATTERFRVQTGSDLEELVALEADKAAVGCDESECLREIAGALGARYVVTGRISRLGQLVVVKLSMLEPEKARTVSTETIEGQSLELLVPEVRKAAARMTARAFGEAISKELEKSDPTFAPSRDADRRQSRIGGHSDEGLVEEVEEGSAFWGAVGWTGLGGMGLGAAGVAGGLGTLVAAVYLLYAVPTSPGLVKGLMRYGGHASLVLVPGGVALLLVSAVVATTGWALE